MTVKPGDRTTITCGCVNEFTPANDWRCVAPCPDHAAVMAHSWVCETCEMGPLDNEGLLAVLAVPAAGKREISTKPPKPRNVNVTARPAVPVGVQPEPAEEETPAETLLRDIFTDPAQRAVPVVHPEPGDRAAKWAKALYPDYEPATILAAPESVRVITVAIALTDAQVAAAVAAVRADLADQIEAEAYRRRDATEGVDPGVPGWVLATIRGDS